MAPLGARDDFLVLSCLRAPAAMDESVDEKAHDEAIKLCGPIGRQASDLAPTTPSSSAPAHPASASLSTPLARMARLGLDAKYSTQRPRFALQLPTRPPSIALPPPSSHRASGSDSPSFPATPAALLHAFASLSPRAKKLFAAALAAILLLGGPIVRRVGDRGHDFSPQTPSPAPSGSFELPPVSPQRTAADGTPRAGLFHPLASAASNDPSVSLSAFLDSHFGPSTLPLEEQPHVWLTMADALWARTGTAALHSFVERLNSERRARYGRREGGVRDTKLVVMCLDDGCVDEVAKYRDAHGRDAGGGYAYGGWRWNRPDKVRPEPLSLSPWARTSEE